MAVHRHGPKLGVLAHHCRHRRSVSQSLPLEMLRVARPHVYTEEPQMNLFSRLLAGTLLVVAHASTALALSIPLFDSAPSTNGFGALTLDKRDGQVIAQPFTVTTPVFVGDISLPVFASAAFDFRIQLVTALGPDNTRSPLADQSYVFDFT